MQAMHKEQKDKFELHLDEMIKKIQLCQREKSLQSCSRCEDYLACQLRDEYVQAVYNSMSKGDTGGFEF
jgi:predicted HD phosphohydrolase